MLAYSILAILIGAILIVFSGIAMCDPEGRSAPIVLRTLPLGLLLFGGGVIALAGRLIHRLGTMHGWW